jgi:hypothetical protein
MVMRAPGRFGYICRYHPNMTGEIIVQALTCRSAGAYAVPITSVA